ncbi:MAG TPA: divalent metal cation transporter [Methylomirabilota bacterium]|nr:divalent metal cation transporter [Methylomirabilota bacterium]
MSDAGSLLHAKEPDKHSHNPLVRYFRVLGPGLVSGAADDDPAGITTYSVAGALLGYGMLWTALATYPLMAAVQLVCARIGLVTGQGLAAVLRAHYPRPLLYAACLLLLIANVFNIGADLGGMGEAAEMLSGVPRLLWVLAFATIIVLVTVYSSYATFARAVKWLTAVLFAYVIAAILARPDWGAVARATFVPSMDTSAVSAATLVAILGTTISPYLFFWQAAHEVEEEKARGHRTLGQRRGATAHELADAALDVNTGMALSIVVMYSIMLSTASTLHRGGERQVETARQAAEALRPVAGDAAYLLYALGLIGTGLLAIPVLAGSASYAVAEVFGWKAGLSLTPRRGRRFYLVLVGSVLLGVAITLLERSPVRVLFLSAIVNGLLAPPLLGLVMLVGGDRRIMGEHVNGPWLTVLGWLATGVMAAAAVAFLTLA